MTREGFFIYGSVIDSARKMEPQDQLAFLWAILDFGMEGKEPPLSGVPDLVFTAIKPIMQKERDAFLTGKKGGRPRNENGGFANTKRGVSENTKPTSTSINTSTSTSTSKGVKGEVAKAPTRPRFIKPSLREVADYAASMYYTGFNADRFLAYYESNGWKVGRNPMKDWKAAVRNWHAKDKAEAKPVSQPTYNELHPIGDFSHEHTNV